MRFFIEYNTQVPDDNNHVSHLALQWRDNSMLRALFVAFHFKNYIYDPFKKEKNFSEFEKFVTLHKNALKDEIVKSSNEPYLNYLISTSPQIYF